MFKKAMLYINSTSWKEVVNNEIESILRNHTWKMKYHVNIDKYKTRTVVKGFRQKEGLYYFDTYSLVTKNTLIQMSIALTIVYSLEIHKMDMDFVFLNGELEERFPWNNLRVS